MVKCPQKAQAVITCTHNFCLEQKHGKYKNKSTKCVFVFKAIQMSVYITPVSFHNEYRPESLGILRYLRKPKVVEELYCCYYLSMCSK